MGEETPANAEASEASASLEAPSLAGSPPPGLLPPKPTGRRFALVLLLAGAIGVGLTLAPHLPHERRLTLRLNDAKHTLGVELSLTRLGESEPLQGSTWHFAEGAAPTSVEMAVNLPDGTYELDATVESAEGKRSFHRALSMSDSDRLTIPLR